MPTTRSFQVVIAALACAGLLTTAAAAQDAPPAPALEAAPGLAPEAVPAPVPQKRGLEQPGLDNSGESARPGADGQAKRDAPKDRDAMLAELYAHLSQARDAEQADPIAKTIEGLWLHSGSETVGLLMRRALKAINDRRNDLAMKLLDAVVDLGPDYAEGWSRRAYVYYLQNDFEHSVGDLRRALALEPNHYKALEGLARILRESGQKKSALGVYQQLLRIHPYFPGAKEAADELSLEVEGQGI